MNINQAHWLKNHCPRLWVQTAVLSCFPTESHWNSQRGECEREVTLTCLQQASSSLNIFLLQSLSFYLTISGGFVYLPILSKVCMYLRVRTRAPFWLLIHVSRYFPDLEMSPTPRCTWPSAPGTQWDQRPVVRGWPHCLGPICSLLLFGYLPWASPLTPGSLSTVHFKETHCSHKSELCTSLDWQPISP